ncbi:ATP-dependent sacrificial sulfur transferase LarE [Acutalibacter sp. 1XD8-33]|uniref:ATP-dependent sacrificial sulfur transferase LarE n=1 Tax=Acutalibacter sp. 1XD8-33 TaxID=2320081 RepID=UPI000EA0ABA3|nr:ATP-dependent sacrificial sulfur transferase LarE [Acutalibacter sp. 1XD8-33]RKJ42231.1 ATP-dependent sacrificial sulfur transferase LarE [Acutalibacter sp. 1XD8-33]
MDLTDFFIENPKVALGLSGGVDSAYLLYAGKKGGADVGAFFIKTMFQPAFELEDARRLCQELGVELHVVEEDILSQEMVRINPPDRCYWCKQKLFSALKKAAAALGYPVVIDGTNASDSAEDRPGMRALGELSVRSPLRECGLTKDQVRALSKEAGLFTWNKPAYACLATRIPTGRWISPEELSKVEQAETFLSGLGFADFRVRVFHGSARIQVREEQFDMALEKRRDILARLGELFPAVLLDLQPRG